jgi:hypothetical protein
LYENSVGFEQNVRVVRKKFISSVDKCKTKTFSRTRYPVEFAYMLARSVLDRVSSINDLGVIMDDEFIGACRHHG